MGLSNLPPGVTDRMLPGYEDDDAPEMGCDLCGTPVSDGNGHYSETFVGIIRLCWSCFGM